MLKLTAPLGKIDRLQVGVAGTGIDYLHAHVAEGLRDRRAVVRTICAIAAPVGLVGTIMNST
jgi:hypothetical protein